jgi:hypothetical protein
MGLPSLLNNSRSSNAVSFEEDPTNVSNTLATNCSDTYQTMKMMQAFDIRWETAAIFLADLDLIMAQACPFGLLLRYDDASI